MYVESRESFSFFLAPYVLFGRGSRSSIPEYAGRLGLNRILLILDAFFVDSDGFHELLKGLQKPSFEPVVWSGVVPNPTDDSVDDAIAVYAREECDGIVCIGGGSALDTGKSVGVAVKAGDSSMRDYLPPTYKPPVGMAPVICVPTTAGTGAEVNPYAIVTNTGTGHKGLAYAGWELLEAQRVAIVDPDLSASMPPGLTMVTGIDAFCHALECFLSLTPNPVSDDLALRSIHLVAHNLARAVYNGGDMKARTNMSLAAMLATMAFPNTGQTYCHCLNEVLVERFHVAHGEAVGALIAATSEALLPFKTARLARVAAAFGVPTQGKSERQLAELAVLAVSQLLRDIQFPTLSTLTAEHDVDLDALMGDFLSRYPRFQNRSDSERIRWTLERSLEF